ncbi:MAG: RHS repeat-associated core domain-containing protein [Streptosporangiaceae bacterium]
MTSIRLRRALRRRVAIPTALALLVPLLAAAPASAAPAPQTGSSAARIWPPARPSQPKAVPGHHLAAGSGRARHVPRQLGAGPAPQVVRTGARVWWPDAASGLGQAGGSLVRATLASTGLRGTARTTAPAVRVTIASHDAATAAGIHGVIMRLSPTGIAQGDAAQTGTAKTGTRLTAEPVSVSLSYARMAQNYGGSWSTRLHLVELPGCALTTPAKAACHREVPLRGTNDVATQTLSGRVTMAPGMGTAVVAATSGASGPQGTYTATSLKMSGTWASQQGDFTYSYPISLPPTLGGQAPGLALSYDSPGFIERSYEPCTQAGIANSGDECWGGYNGTLSLDGHSSTLVEDGSSSTYRLQGDDGTTVQLETGASNGLWDGEYWVVTTSDGTKYYFGRNHLPTDGSSGTASNSAWGVPVYNPTSGDPCYSSSAGQASECQMGWRWNLDYVVAPDNNLTVYDYTAQTNYYDRGAGQNSGKGTLTEYTRGGYLTYMYYGWLLSDAIAGDSAAAEVVFNNDPRCTTTGSACNNPASNPGDFPDVPTDQICASSGTCTNYSPSYFSTYRLNTIVPEVLSGTSYTPVDSYALGQEYLADANANVMFLDSITRTGKDGGSSALPAMTFSPIETNNLVGGQAAPAVPVYRPRIQTITTETGSEITVVYKAAHCGSGTMPGSQSDNNLPCFPVWWSPSTGVTPVMDYFNKSLVKEVEVIDNSGAGSPTQVTQYSYGEGSAAMWHQDESPTVLNSDRTWDQFRGYQQVTTTTGTAPDPVTQTVTTYMQGMNGDPLVGGGTESASVSDTLGQSYPDSNWLAGNVLETDTYTKINGTIDKKTIDVPGTYTQTASQSQPYSLPNLNAYLLQQDSAETLSLGASGSWLTNTTTSYYNGDALVTAVDVNPQGSTQTCTQTSYATPPSGNSMMENYPDQVTEVTEAASGGACPAASSSNIVSDTKTYYDDSSSTLSSMGTLGSLASPGGLATGVTKAATWPSGGSEAWQPQSATSYDEYGRVVSSTTPSAAGGSGDTSTTAYTPATGQLPTETVVTNPLNWTTTTKFDQGRQLPEKITDPNGNITTEAYDPLGRLTSVTEPQDQSAGDATYTYSYDVSNSSPSSVTTNTLREDGTYGTEIQIYDGILQLVQEQQTPTDGESGALITDMAYDSHGWQTQSSEPYYITSAPSTSLFTPKSPDSVPALNVTQYDGQGRSVAAQFYSEGQQEWQSTTSYPGMNQTDTTPASGGTATSTFTNAIGQTTATWSYNDSSSPTGKQSNATVTSYTYNPAGQVAAVADNAGNTWSYGYNLLGDETSSSDPGATASSTYSYDPASNLSSSTDPRGQTLDYTYDALNRMVGEYSGSVAPASELDSWTYDTIAKGQLTSSTAYTSSGSSSPGYTEAVTGYTAAYQPTGTSTSIPSGPFQGTYTTSNQYSPLTGLLTSTAYSPDGGLPAETVNYSYDEEGLISSFDSTVNSATVDYLDQDTYTPQGQVTFTLFGTSPDQMARTFQYDTPTNRLQSSTLDLQNLDAAADSTTYSYNQAGDVTATSDVQNTGGTETQCFSYDDLQQLTKAWTDTGGTTSASPGAIGGCDDTSPTAATIGGPATYWESYGYDALGDRTSQTVYDTASQSVDTPANETTQTLTYPGDDGATAASQPDAATSITTTGPNGATTSTPGYDAAGNTTSVDNSSVGNSPPAAPPAASNAYNAQGQTASVTNGSGTSSYTYDANGNLLIQSDPSGSTLYLDNGAEELSYSPSTQTVTGLRFYNAPDGSVIVRSSSGALSYEAANQQGTAVAAVNASNLSFTRRYYDPWGNQVGTAPASWPDNRGFLGKPADTSTELDLLGARQYDPVTGSFLSLDPLFEEGDPVQMSGYTYAGENPETDSDPTGDYITTGNGCETIQACYPHSPPKPTTTGSGSGNGNGGSDSGSEPTPGTPAWAQRTAYDFIQELPHHALIVAAYETAEHNAQSDWGNTKLPPYKQYDALLTACASRAGLCSSEVLKAASVHANYDRQAFLGARAASINKYSKETQHSFEVLGVYTLGALLDLGCTGVTAAAGAYACSVGINAGTSWADSAVSTGNAWGYQQGMALIGGGITGTFGPTCDLVDCTHAIPLISESSASYLGGAFWSGYVNQALDPDPSEQGPDYVNGTVNGLAP